MTFEEAVSHVLSFEGGYVLDMRDPGGETNFGISKRAFPFVEIKSLNRAAAEAIYKKEFWDRIGIEKLPESMRLIVFDAAVNQGPDASIKMLQNVLDLSQDGVLGPEVETKSHQIIPLLLVQRYAIARLRRYLSMRDFETYGGGWLRRLISVATECGAEAGRPTT